MKKLALIALLLSCATAQAQSGHAVTQSGNITPGHPARWCTNGVICDGGTPANGSLTGVGVTVQGPGICQNSGPITGAYTQVCLNATTASGSKISVYNYNGASAGFTFDINGTIYQFPFVIGGIVGPPTTTIGNVALWANGTGTLLSDGGAPLSMAQLTSGEGSASALPGAPVYISAASTFKLARANAFGTAGVIGLSSTTILHGAGGSIQISAVMALTTGQWDTVTGGSGGLTAGSLYFLDPSTAGMLTATPPSTAGQVITLIGRALSTTQMLLTVGQPILL